MFLSVAGGDTKKVTGKVEFYFSECLSGETSV